MNNSRLLWPKSRISYYHIHITHTIRVNKNDKYFKCAQIIDRVIRMNKSINHILHLFIHSFLHSNWIWIRIHWKSVRDFEIKLQFIIYFYLKMQHRKCTIDNWYMYVLCIGKRCHLNLIRSIILRWQDWKSYFFKLNNLILWLQFHITLYQLSEILRRICNRKFQISSNFTF